MVGPLTDPAAHGGDEADAFDVVIPALPGYPFSRARTASAPGRRSRPVARLMTDVLGYPRFVASGGDLGAMVTAALGALHADVVDAIQLMAVFGSTTLDDPTLSRPSGVPHRAGRVGANGGRVRAPAGHEPRTLAFGLSDSPAGMLAWIVEKYRAWSDGGGVLERSFTPDQLLVTPTLYWAANSIGASFRPYADTGRPGAPVRRGPGRRHRLPRRPAVARPGVRRPPLQRPALDGDAARRPLRGAGGARAVGRGDARVLRSHALMSNRISCSDAACLGRRGRRSSHGPGPAFGHALARAVGTARALIARRSGSWAWPRSSAS